MPPFKGVAVYITEPPAQMVLLFEVIDTDGVTFGVTVRVMLLEVTTALVTHAALDVIFTDT